MNLNDSIRSLRAVNAALEKVNVSGRDNMDILLGSMQHLDRTISQLVTLQMELDKNQPEIEDEKSE